MEALTANYYEAVLNLDLVPDDAPMEVAAGIPHKVVVSEDMEVGEMRCLMTAQILHMELDGRQDRPKTRWRCDLRHCRSMIVQIGPRAGFDYLGLEKDGKEIEARHDAQHSMKELAVDLD